MIRILLLILLLPSLALAGTERFVRCSTGSDSNDGSSWANSYLTINHCRSESQYGDICTISNNESCDFSTLGAITWSGFSGGSGGFIIQGGDDGGSLVLDRPGWSATIPVAEFDGKTTTSSFSTSTPENVIFRNIRFKDFNGTTGLTSQVYLHQVEVTGFSQAGADGITFSFDSAISDSYIHDNTTLSAISLTGDTTYSYNNYYEDNIPSAIYNDRGTLVLANGAYSIKDVFNNNKGAITINSWHGKVFMPTINGSTDTNSWAVRLNGSRGIIRDGVIANLTGTGSVGIKKLGSNDLAFLGHNGFFNNTSNIDSIIIYNDKTSVDITGASDPFVDVVSNDLSVAGSDAENASNAYGENTDLGAVESASGSGGGSGGGTCIINGC